jgi:uncharacterized DUF497 family protein
MISIRRLIWDSWNVAHIARHNVSPYEVEEVCQGNFMSSATYKGRIRVLGPTRSGRMLVIILAPRETRDYYTVTAHDANPPEERRYYQVKGSKP